MGIHIPVAYACGCEDQSELATTIIVERRDGLAISPVTMNGAWVLTQHIEVSALMTHF
jgi:hypothetical protein